MDQNNRLSSHCDTDSFPGFQPWSTKDFDDVKKKRKLLIEQLNLPTPKLPCWGPRPIRFPHGNNFKFNRNPQKDEEEEESKLIKMTMEVKEMSKEEVVPMEGETERDGIKEKFQQGYGYEEDLLEFGSHGSSSIYEQCCSSVTAQSLLLPRDSNHDLVLSSGRWSIDPEAESKTNKPTIDEEFEQYFSVLLPSFDP